MQYLAYPFAEWKEEQEQWEQVIEHNLIVVWSAFKSQPELTKLTGFAKLLLSIVVNQVGCGQVFSDLKVKQTQCCN